MSGIVGSKFNHRGSGLVGSLGTDGQHMLSSGAGKKHVFETVSAAETDLQPIKSDISALALREATNEASAAFNLPNQFIDTYSDSTNLGTTTDCERQSGFVATQVSVATVPADADDWNEDVGSYTLGTGTLNCTTSDNSIYTDWVSGTGDFTVSLIATEVAYGGDGSKFGLFDVAEVGDWVSNAYSGMNTMDKSWGVEGGTGSNATAARTFYGNTSTGQFTNTNSANAFIHGATYKFKRRAGVMTFTETPVSGSEITVHTWTQEDSVSCRFAWGDNGNAPVMGECASLSLSAIGGAPNATGTLIQSTNTVASAKTKVGGTILYKDADGTATLGTDLKIYFSCDNGSNWTEAASYNAITPVFSSGIKQARLGETTCTSGTGVIYKAVWANQSEGSKLTQLHGVGINY